jgi:flagellar basal body-associated protein FliL
MQSGGQTAGLMMRRRLLWMLLLALGSVAALSAWTAVASAQETSTTGVGIPLVTTASPTTTANATATASGTAAPTGGAAAAPGGVGVTAAPSGWQPLNPGIIPAEILVQIWPEYDTTSTEVLVLVTLTVPDSVPLPFTFKYAVPKGARVTGFAMVAPNGNFDYNRPNPQFSSGGSDWDLVTVTVPTYRQIHLEYYFSPGIAASGAKKYAAVFISPADTPKLTEAVQQPLRSTAFSIDPPGVDSGADAEGFNYKTETFANVKDGDRVRVDVSYTKSDADPSKPAGATATPGQTQSTRWFIILLVVLVLVVAGLVVYRLFFQKKGRKPSGGQRRPPQGGQRRPPESAGAGQSSAGGSGPSRFCTQCGAKLTKRDRFCPQCGNERES